MMESGTILIVDDDQTTLLTLEAILTPTHRCVLVESGEEAINELGKSDPDIVLLDIHMPGINGFDLCRTIRTMPTLVDIPILMFTHDHDPETRILGLECGADDFLTKPLDPIELRIRLENTLRLNRYRRLTEEHSRFEWVFDNSRIGFALLDHKDTIIQVNNQASLYLETHEKLLPHSNFINTVSKTYTLIPPAHWNDWNESDINLNAIRYLYQPETDNSNELWLEVSVQSSKSLNEMRLISIQDITDELHERRSRWSFQSMVTHKLRTPLSAITTCAYILEHSDPDDWKDELSPLKDVIIHETNRLENQIEETLSYLNSNPAENKEKRLQVSLLADFINNTAKPFELDIQIATSYSDQTGNLCVGLSRTAFTSTILELLTNAQKFHPTKSPIVSIDIRETSDFTLCIAVTNTGSSITAEQISNAFTPYYQGEKQPTGEIPGMGLGLSMIGSMVWQVMGSCRIMNTREGDGVTFEMEFPLFSCHIDDKSS